MSSRRIHKNQRCRWRRFRWASTGTLLGFSRVSDGLEAGEGEGVGGVGTGVGVASGVGVGAGEDEGAGVTATLIFGRVGTNGTAGMLGIDVGVLFRTLDSNDLLIGCPVTDKLLSEFVKIEENPAKPESCSRVTPELLNEVSGCDVFTGSVVDYAGI